MHSGPVRQKRQKIWQCWRCSWYKLLPVGCLCLRLPGHLCLDENNQNIGMAGQHFSTQAAIFYLPFKLWTVLEANLVASFGTDGKSPVMLSEDAKYDDGVVQVLRLETDLYLSCMWSCTIVVVDPVLGNIFNIFRKQSLRSLWSTTRPSSTTTRGTLPTLWCASFSTLSCFLHNSRWPTTSSATSLDGS